MIIGSTVIHLRLSSWSTARDFLFFKSIYTNNFSFGMGGLKFFMSSPASLSLSVTR